MSDKQQEKQLLETFVSVYCHKKHATEKGRLCADCRELLDYALEKLQKCPFDPKPKCKHCRVHCYQEPYRTKIKEVMKFSGIHFVKRGRIDWLIKYFLK
jgi:hypothetical protein